MGNQSAFEKMVSVGQLVATLFLGGVGVFYTQNKDNFDRGAKQIELISTWLGQCSSNDSKDLERITSILGLYYEPGAIDAAPMDGIFGSHDAFKHFRDVCISRRSASNANSSEADAIKPTPEQIKAAANAPVPTGMASGAPSSPSASTKYEPRFWIYLGTYKAPNWVTSYVDNIRSRAPQNISLNKCYAVRQETGTLNVRYGAFSATGEFPPITAPLQPGQKVRIRGVEQWFDSGNWWAIVDPPQIGEHSCSGQPR